jgi:hypothetical protein
VRSWKKLLLAALGAAAVAGIVALAFLGLRRGPGRAAASPPVALAVPSERAEAVLWIDIHSPAPVWRAARSNRWLARALADPLGQGFASSWAAFLGTRGEDLSGAFEGMVVDVVASKLLADPFRVIFYGGPGATGAPAVLVPRPSAGARSAFDLLERVAGNGSLSAPRCPGAEADAASPIVVSRWLLADHPVFAGSRDGRIALAKNPVAVVQALCAAPAETPPAAGVDVTLALAPEGLGREGQLVGALLGVGPTLRLAFGVEDDRLQPRGIVAELAAPGRLGGAAPPEKLLRLVPADSGVVIVADLELPAPLSRESLAQHLRGAWKGDTAPRTVAVVWNPRGDAALPTEVALAWPEADAAALRDAFTGPNRLEHRRACGHEILASTGALAGAMARACDGKVPSILNGAPPVADGLRAPASLGMTVNLGLVLSRLVADARAAERGAAPPAPEVEAARRLLEELPTIGLRGVAADGALRPGGYRS